MVNFKPGDHLPTSFSLQQDQTELLLKESEESLEIYTIPLYNNVINFTFTRLSDVFLSFNALFMAHVSCNVMDLLSFPWCVLLWMHTFPFPFSSLYHLFGVNFVNPSSFEFLADNADRQAQVHQILAIVKRRDAVSGVMFWLDATVAHSGLAFRPASSWFFFLSEQEKGKI